MAYDKGNFYHEKGVQVIDNVSIENSMFANCGTEELEIGEAKLLQVDEAPTSALLAPAGSLCICTASGSVGLYINKGTATAPSWKAVTTEA